MRKLLSNSLTFALLIIALAVLINAFLGRGAPVPPMFDSAPRLAEAIGESEESGRVVLAVATADWCGPCQSYKAGALINDRVEAWVAENAVPVYIDVDRNREEAERLGVRSIPATFLIEGGEVVAKVEGSMSGRALVEWLERHAGETVASQGG